MENHPIPQDVTGFQFKLIGNMTIKQFAYLATGVILAWVFFQLPISALIKLPLSAFFAILGTGLAYFPVSGRPMDVMIGNFIKALIRPTEFIYEKTGTALYYSSKLPSSPVEPKVNPAIERQKKLNEYLQNINTPQHVAAAHPKTQAPYVSPITIIKNTPGPQIILPHTDSIKPTQILTQPTAVIQEQSAPIQTQATPIAHPVAPKKELVQKSQFREDLKSILRTQGKGFALPNIPDSPNLITGVTKDSRGNALPHILVEIQDKEGNPVRAFKTNEFGRFASATPLANGEYTIKFEDPKAQNKFEQKIINITGQVISPIIAVSIDTREELRRSLFSKN